MEREQRILLEHPSSPPCFQGGSCCSIVSFRCSCCLVDRCCPFFFCPLCCLSFFYLRILITPLVSSNSFFFIIRNILAMSYMLCFLWKEIRNLHQSKIIIDLSSHVEFPYTTTIISIMPRTTKVELLPSLATYFPLICQKKDWNVKSLQKMVAKWWQYLTWTFSEQKHCPNKDMLYMLYKEHSCNVLYVMFLVKRNSNYKFIT